jgi:hypothetical protein
MRAYSQDLRDRTINARGHFEEMKVSIKKPAIRHQLNKWNLSYKKILRAGEQDRPDIQEQRRCLVPQ